MAVSSYVFILILFIFIFSIYYLSYFVHVDVYYSKLLLFNEKRCLIFNGTTLSCIINFRTSYFITV